jgi:hypothetical protein
MVDVIESPNETTIQAPPPPDAQTPTEAEAPVPQPPANISSR